MNIKVTFQDNTQTIRPTFRKDTTKPTFQPQPSTSSVRIEPPKATTPVKFSQVNIVKENVIPAYGRVKIGDIEYSSLDSAIAEVKSGETITLHSDITSHSPLYFTTDFCLDLNGYTLTAPGVSVFANGGSIVDNGEVKGLLAVPHGCLLLTHAKYEMLPLWNEEGTGYVFTEVTQKYLVRDEEVTETGLKIVFLPSFSSGGVDSSTLWADGALDNGITFEITAIRYDDKGAVVSEFSMPAPDEQIASIYKNQKAFTFTFSGLARNSTYGIELIFRSDTGLTYNYEYGRFNTGVFTPIAPM